MSEFPWGPQTDPGYIPGLGRGAEGFEHGLIEDAIIEIEDDSFGTSKMSSAQVKREQEADEKADKFYKTIEENLKRKKKKKDEDEGPSKQPQTLFDQVRSEMADVMEPLKGMTADQWANIPVIGNSTARRPKWELYTYASDRSILNDFSGSRLNREVNGEFDILSVANAHRSVLEVQLSKISVGDSNVLNVSDFQKELDAQTETVLKQFSDLDAAAQLYRNFTHTNPMNEQSWLIRGRIEERRGFLDKARKIIEKGFIECPNSEKLVLEAARLSPRSEAIRLIQSALQVNQRKSEKLWLTLISYQNDIISKKHIVENALQELPHSELLWRAAATLDDDNNMEIISRALTFLPKSKNLWIEGIRNSPSIEKAREFAENAFKELPDNPDILLNLAKAEEQFSPDSCHDQCFSLCKHAIDASLKLNHPLDISENKENLDGKENSEDEENSKDSEKSEKNQEGSLFSEVQIKDDTENTETTEDENKNWINEAQLAEKNGFPVTAEAIASNIPYSNDFVEKGELAARCQLFIVAKQLLSRAAKGNGFWKPYFQFEIDCGDIDSAITQSIGEYPQNEDLILAAADVLQKARSNHKLIRTHISSLDILRQGIQRIPNSETIAETLLTLLIQNENLEEAYQFGQTIIQQIHSPNLYTQFATFVEIYADQFDSDQSIPLLSILETGVEKFPNQEDLWIMLANRSESRIDIMKRAVKASPHNGALHIRLISEVKKAGFPKPVQRALFEQARNDCPENSIVWLCASYFENNSRLLEEAKKYVSEPGLIWAREIEISPPEGRNSMANELLRTTGRYREILLELAISQWKHGQDDLAKETFDEITKENPTWGDGWFWKLKFLTTKSSQKVINEANKIADSIKFEDGFVWTRFKKERQNFGLTQSELLDALIQETTGIEPILRDDVSIFLNYLDI